MSSNPLIDVGSVSKPIDTFVQKVADAIGGIYRPMQIIRVAKAEAEANIIKTLAEEKITELRRRSLRRFLSEEETKQINIEEITKKAIPLIDKDAIPEDMDNDWIVNFIDKCKLVSDEEMQKLWAKILAGEANSAGSFSKRTINSLNSLDKKDAEVFTNFCSFVWSIGKTNYLQPLIYNHRNAIYSSNQLTFQAIVHLESIGLIIFDSIKGYKLAHQPKIINLAYFGDQFELEFPNEIENLLDLGEIMFSQIGFELASIITSAKKNDYRDFVLNSWKKKGLLKGTSS